MGTTGQWLQCPPALPLHSTATPPSSFWDSLRKFPHHRVSGKSTPVGSLRALGSPIITLSALQLGAWLPPAPEWAEMSYVAPPQASMPFPEGKAVCPGDSHSYLAGGNAQQENPQHSHKPLQVMTPTTEHLLLQVTLCFKPIPQLIDPTKFITSWVPWGAPNQW